ncbi:hypothetical protein E2562_038093 [Oryza meyeriana var. granulata]|uniref:Uncharacterized protein n=1 Tax=Oryza meyeriana var. granulata TaxID=110450 RepID=A0A6G1CCY6_9ORYZ|nr:hypothetical protein E2562_038093 [Oryza meyeriana var. granulata]
MNQDRLWMLAKDPICALQTALASVLESAYKVIKPSIHEPQLENPRELSPPGRTVATAGWNHQPLCNLPMQLESRRRCNVNPGCGEDNASSAAQIDVAVAVA